MESKSQLKKYLFTSVLLATLTLLGFLIEPFAGYRSVGFLFLLGVNILGMLGNFRSTLLTAVLSAMLWDYFFIPPKYTFFISQPEDIVLCLSYLVAALITGFLTYRLKNHEKTMRDKEERTSILYQILSDISSSQGKSEFIEKITDRVGAILNGSCGVFLKSKDKEKLESKLYGTSLGELSDKETAVALWSFQNKQIAGWSTQTLGVSDAIFIPLLGSSEAVGVFIFRPNDDIEKLDPEQDTLLNSIVSLIGVSIERHFLSRRLNEAQRLKDSEYLHQTLLNSISHEIRTPLTAILATTAILETKNFTEPQLDHFITELSSAAERLNRVVENLLDMNRLNSGILALKMEWQDISDVVGVVLKKLEKIVRKNSITVEVGADIGLVKADFRLLEHAISNLVANAALYSGDSSPIKICASKHRDKVFISIEDLGSGIPEDSVPNIFEKFYRVPGSPPGGTGLGLSIVKGIVEIHKGEVRYERNQPRGSKFIIELPLELQPEMPLEIES